MNVRALRKVQQQILAEPKGFDMNYYHSKNECGTTHCIAGYAALNAKLVALAPSGDFYLPTPKAVEAGIHPKNTRGAAMHALGIDYEQSARLFYTCDWPKKFWDAYEKAKTLRGKASVAAHRIDHFIATRGAE